MAFRAGYELADRIAAALEAWGLPVRCPPLSAESIWGAMAHDKKKQGRGLRWVLPLEIGKVEITDEVAPEIVQGVREEIGPVAAFKRACVVQRLPKTRSGKVLRGTMRKIADAEPYRIPATIDDPTILEELRTALLALGYAR